MTTLAEWAAIKPLTKLTIPWPAPDERYKADDGEHVELTRILGAITVHADYTTEEQVFAALNIAKQAEMRRARPIRLGVLFLPWPTPCAPDSAEAMGEFYATYEKWRVIRSALDASTYRPVVVCLVDTETFDARAEPNGGKIAELYDAYETFLGAITNCSAVEWYGWGPWPGPCEPDGWCTQKWAVLPFDGQKSVGFELYHVGEIGLQRDATRRARALADTRGVAATTAWVSAPGCGRRFTFNDAFQEWVWDIGPDTRYSAELGRELYRGWHGARPERFMAQPSRVVFYPHPFNPRIVDPDRKHLLAFLKAATE